jgi:hypothetical protein
VCGVEFDRRGITGERPLDGLVLGTIAAGGSPTAEQAEEAAAVVGLLGVRCVTNATERSPSEGVRRRACRR